MRITKDVLDVGTTMAVTIMYDVIKMKTAYAAAVEVARKSVEDEFHTAFRTMYPDNCVPDALHPAVDRIEIRTTEDFGSIYYGEGFYVILSDRPVAGNECRLKAGALVAIYRGECGETRLRVRSHLANTAYQAEMGKRAQDYERNPKNGGRRFYKPLWPHCLKLDGKGGPSGINVDQAPYSSFRWQILVHRMKGSSQDIRKIAETAFDMAFGKPAASREK